MDWKEVKKLIPNGVQTLSKMPNRHTASHPTYLARGEGATVWDDKGADYIDYPCGLGTNLLGYGNQQVNAALIDAISTGNIFSLPHKKEAELAELLCDVIPSFEMVRFLKTGSEACSAAVRIARAYTGRNKIIACGYHGWHDWYNWTTDKKDGTPKQTVKQLKYNEYESFVKELGAKKVAAIIMEPYIYEAPKDGFLERLRKLCTDTGTLLIFDEVVTGFRTEGLSAQQMFEVMPDLSTFGKAMANGIPIAAVGGKREIMKVLEKDCFVSSTWGGDLLGINAAIACITYCREHSVPDGIWKYGHEFIEGFNQQVKAMCLDDVSIEGYPCRTKFNFPTSAHKSLFWQECVKRGVLFGYAQFISHSHQRGEIDRTINVMREALHMVRKYWDNPEEYLEGEPAVETIRRTK